MSVCQLRIGDGRETLHDLSAASLEEHLPYPDKIVIVDDADHELGFAGAIVEAWRQACESGCDWVWHAEMDFLYTAPVPLDRMIAVLKRKPYLTQMALKRQPVNDEEKQAGGVVELKPSAYEQIFEGGDIWTEHRRFFTTNPSVYPVALCYQGWLNQPDSEGHFALRLFEDEHARSAYWGAKFDPPLVEHLGGDRAGVGY